MYLAGKTFLPRSQMQSDSLYGLGAPAYRAPVAANTYTAGQRKPQPAPTPPARPQFKPIPAVIRVDNRLLRRVYRRGGNVTGGLGWYQAVANIVSAGAQVYAAKEATKTQEKAQQIQAQSVAAQKELLMLESALTDKRAQAAQQGKLLSQKNVLIASGIAGAAGVIYLATRKRGRRR